MACPGEWVAGLKHRRPQCGIPVLESLVKVTLELGT